MSQYEPSVFSYQEGIVVKGRKVFYLHFNFVFDSKPMTTKVCYLHLLYPRYPCHFNSMLYSGFVYCTLIYDATFSL